MYEISMKKEMYPQGEKLNTAKYVPAGKSAVKFCVHGLGGLAGC